MRTQIARWGNSLAVRLPRQLAAEIGLADGTLVDIDVVDGTVRVSSARPVYALADLLAGVTPDNIPESFDDQPVGRELL
jgi:antitoxin MazE